MTANDVTRNVTVVIPTHDRHELALRAIASALAQRDVVVEVVVVDDGSPVPVPAFIDERVRVLRHETPQGVAQARNDGTAAGSYEWVAFLDDDDFWAPTKLAEQIDEALKQNRRWCVTGAVLVDLSLSERGISLPKSDPCEIATDLCTFNAVPGGGSSVLMERALLQEVGGFDVGLSMVADWELWHRVAHRYPCAIVRSPLVGYSVHDLSMTHTFDGYDDEMRGLSENSARYCQTSTSTRRLIYDSWLAGNIVKYDRVRAAKIKFKIAIKRGSVSELLLAARFLLIPHTFSGRRALGLAPKHLPTEPTPWLDDFRALSESATSFVMSDTSIAF